MGIDSVLIPHKCNLNCGHLKHIYLHTYLNLHLFYEIVEFLFGPLESAPGLTHDWFVDFFFRYYFVTMFSVNFIFMLGNSFLALTLSL